MSEIITMAVPPPQTAYGRAVPSGTLPFSKVGPGTACGEFLRRYWHPVALSRAVTNIRPLNIKILGEELVLFRDKTGRIGLLYPRCMHRGTSLYYGRIEERGLRCCYHGWLYDVQGNCLEQPCEPDNGRHRSAARQPWYPVRERYGMVFAYLGPPQKRPELPRYAVFENLPEGERIAVDDGSWIGTHGDHGMPVNPYTWMHTQDNFMDPYHVYVLHSTFSVQQFAAGFSVKPDSVEFEAVPTGVVSRSVRTLEGGRRMTRITSVTMPNVASIPEVKLKELKSSPAMVIMWNVPLDDTHHQTYMAVRTRVPADESLFQPMRYAGKTWNEMTPQERRDAPGDFEAQGSQGPITLNSEEHLVSSDRGIILLRKLMLKQIEAVATGADPAGVTFDPATPPIALPAGNFYEESD